MEPPESPPPTRSGFWGRRSRRGKIFLILGAFLLIVIVIGAFSSPEDEGQDAAATTASSETAPTETEEAAEEDEEEPAPSAECVEVPADLVAALEEGFNTAGVTLRNAYAVKSDDLQNAWFISGDLEGPGLEGEDEIATWAKSGELEVGGGLLIASEAIAREFSDWGEAAQPGSPAAEAASMENHGAEESQACVRDSFE